MATQKELKRLHAIHKAIEGAITQAKAAETAGLSERQVRRIIKRIREEGDSGIVHKSRGRTSNRAKHQSLKDRLIELWRIRVLHGFTQHIVVEVFYEHG